LGVRVGMRKETNEQLLWGKKRQGGVSCSLKKKPAKKKPLKPLPRGGSHSFLGEWYIGKSLSFWGSVCMHTYNHIGPTDFHPRICPLGKVRRREGGGGGGPRLGCKSETPGTSDLGHICLPLGKRGKHEVIPYLKEPALQGRLLRS